MCRAAVRDPLAGRLEAEEALAVAREADGNPTALCLGLLGVGRALQRTDPAAALVLLDDSAEAAASVRNRWFYAFARMYAAATRGVHSDPAVAARAFLEVLEAWERLGDWSQQWLSLLYVTRLLLRIGAAAEVVTLHYALVAAAKPAPLDADRLALLAEALDADAFDAAARRGSDMDGPAVVAFVRSILRGSGSGSGPERGASSGAVTGPAGLAASGGHAVEDRVRPAGGQRADQLGRLAVGPGPDDGEHRPHQRQGGGVPGEHPGVHPADADPGGLLDDRGQQPAADAAALPCVDHLERDLGLVLVPGVANEPGDADRLPAGRLGDQRDMVAAVDVEQCSAQRRGQPVDRGVEAQVAALGESPANTASSGAPSSRRSGRTRTSMAGSSRSGAAAPGTGRPRAGATVRRPGSAEPRPG